MNNVFLRSPLVLFQQLFALPLWAARGFALGGDCDEVSCAELCADYVRAMCGMCGCILAVHSSSFLAALVSTHSYFGSKRSKQR